MSITMVVRREAGEQPLLEGDVHHVPRVGDLMVIDDEHDEYYRVGCVIWDVPNRRVIVEVTQ